MKRILCTFNQWQFYWFGQRSNETCLQRKKKQEFKISRFISNTDKFPWYSTKSFGHEMLSDTLNLRTDEMCCIFFSELLWTDELSWNFYKIKYIEFRLKMICHWQSFIYRKFSIIFIINKAELFWYCTWQKAEEF